MVNSTSPYPRGDVCPQCGACRQDGQGCWCHKERPELRAAAWIIAFCGGTGVAAWVSGGAMGGASVILRPFGLVIFLGALLSALFILADELTSSHKDV